MFKKKSKDKIVELKAKIFDIIEAQEIMKYRINQLQQEKEKKLKELAGLKKKAK